MNRVARFDPRFAALVVSILVGCGTGAVDDDGLLDEFSTDAEEALVASQSCLLAPVCTTSLARPQCLAGSTEASFAFESHQFINVTTPGNYSFVRLVLKRIFRQTNGLFEVELRELATGSTSIESSTLLSTASVPGAALPRVNTAVTLHFASPVALAPPTGSTPRYVLVFRVTNGTSLSVGIACAELVDALPGVTAGLRKSLKVGAVYEPGPRRSINRDVSLALGIDGISAGPCATTVGATCDDGNATSGDGCSGACQVEPGFTCDGVPSVCIDPSVQNKVSVAVSGLAGTLGLSLDGTESLSVTTNATHDFTRRYGNGASYAVTITGQPAGQACTLGANASGTLSSDVVVTVSCVNAYTVTNNQPAVIAIGQPNLTSGGQGLSASAFFVPAGNPVYLQGKLWVVDRQNNRILRFNGVPSTMPGTAELVLGQPNFTTNTAGSGLNQLRNPQAIAASDTQLFVADGDNRRILVFNLDGLVTGASAAFAIGGGSGCSALAYSMVGGVAVVGNKLVMSDFNQHRVLIWNTLPTNGTTAPDLVLGQADFTTCTSGLSSTRMNAPYAVFADANRIVVSEFTNRRVLVWSPFPTATNTAASVVIGKPNFTTNTGTASQSVIQQPYAAAMSGEQLFVADTAANRLLVWNTFPTSNGAAADRVIGQADFTTTTSGSSATKLRSPSGVAFVLGKFLVTDGSNNRVLVYENPP